MRGGIFLTLATRRRTEGNFFGDKGKFLYLMILRPRGHAQSLTKAFVSGSFQMDAHTGAYGTNGAQQYSEDGLPSKGEKELIGMPSVELIPDPDENLTEAEKKAAVCFLEVV